MAYSLNDMYASLRMIMRIDGLILGVGVGLYPLFAPRGQLATAETGALALLWPARLAGGVLLALGIMLLLAAQERAVSNASLVAMLVANGATALVLLFAYLQGEFDGLGLGGEIALVGLFLICLVGAVAPLRYLRTDYGVL